MSKHKSLRYTMFGSLYFSQGTVFGYFTALNAIYFLSKGLSMTDVGIFASIALIPFVIKIFLGMLSDRISLFGLGHRKPYILLGLAVQTVCLLAAPFIDPARYYWVFVAIAFILQMGMALYDTCTDGLALDTTPPEEQGTIQGFMVGGRALGVLITASIVGLLAQYVSWLAVFWSLALFTLLPVPLVLTAREPERSSEREFDWRAFSAFKEKTVLALCGVGFVFFLVIAGANQIVNPFLQTEFNISLSSAGLYTTIWGLGVVLGGLTGGRLMSRMGQRKSAQASLWLSFFSILALAFVLSPQMAWPLVFLFGIAYGVYQTVYFALAMSCTDPRIAASMYSILMAVTNVSQGIGLALSGVLADQAGFRWAFVILTLFNLLALPLFPILFSQPKPAKTAPSV